MKKSALFLILLTLITFFGVSSEARTRVITQKIFDGATFPNATDTNFSSPAIALTDAIGYFSLYVDVDSTIGTPAVKLEYYLSHDGTTYSEPSGATDIAASCAADAIYNFSPTVGCWLKVLATGDSTATDTTLTGWLMWVVEE